MNSNLYYKVVEEIQLLEDKLILDSNGKIIKGNANNKNILLQLKCWEKMKNYIYIY
ncbi:hypothetical protein LL033_11900 [Clostridium estertheticum]|uniref:hypothetical protein n=1 Tax=Clostridium estertheticum TaxID=238834 RepID=UPI00227BFFF0|nr:hypothetical protein [Clostridium estertheticum]WAG57810.1 hypothetical protein LL033_11900 [Clostridium estertheticum]